AVIGHPALRKVVGADALGTIPRAHQQFARLGDFLVRSRLLLILQLGRQPGHGLGAVLVLGALFLEFHHGAGGNVGDAGRRVGGVDVLTTGARTAEGIDAQIGRIDLDGGLLVRLWQYHHGAGGGVDAALGFGFRHTLHAMGAGLELELCVDIVALDAGNHFLETAVLALVGRQHLDTPALLLGITRVHAEQVAGEYRRLVTASTGAD